MKSFLLQFQHLRFVFFCTGKKCYIQEEEEHLIVENEDGNKIRKIMREAKIMHVSK
jgi:hypothetical protein